MEHSKVWGAWPVALGSASSGLPLKMLPLKIYGSAQSVPGARIPVHSEDSLSLAGLVTLRSPQEGASPGPPSCLTKANKPGHLPCPPCGLGALAS